MDAVIQSLAKEGYMLTQRRMQIIDYLWDKTEINDIEALWLEIRSSEPVSWATMYTTVKLLYKLGWLELKEEKSKKTAYRWRRN